MQTFLVTLVFLFGTSPHAANRVAPVQTPAAPAAIPVLVELFTSEGCSSCPPADKLLAEFIERQPVPGVQVIGLSEHVDYWDSLGWKDRFSSSAFTRRQQIYAENLHVADPYTPQMVVGGSRQVVGSDEAGLLRAIRAASQQPALVLTLSNFRRQGNTVQVDAAISTVQAAAPLTLFAALTDDSDVTAVQSGENGGSTLRHAGVVRKLKTFGAIAPGQPKTIQIALPEAPAAKMHIVVFAQSKNQGPVAATASMPI